MNIQFASSIRQKLVSMRLGVIDFTARVENTSPDLWRTIETECAQIQQILKAEEITLQPEIAAARLAYKKCGKDPSRYRPSADSLMRRIVKGLGLYQVNNVVEVLNLVSLQTGFSIGGYNTNSLKGTILMDIGRAEEVYTGIGRGELNIEGLPVLRDEIGVFGSPTSDSERSMIGSETLHTSFVFFDFGISEKLQSAIENCEKLLQKYCQIDDVKISFLEYGHQKHL
ncbi:MAG: hypothetical protein IPM71_07635 [Bacteroidota bacterium]|nr:MAG: hypothetical protein IPM71_07635 [Bacteroidota bacterium]